jgi:hypothetical protein
MRLSFRNGFYKQHGPDLMPFELPELLHGPRDQRLVEVPQDRIHG